MLNQPQIYPMRLFPTHFDRRFVKNIKNITVFLVPILGPILGPILLFGVLSWGHAMRCCACGCIEQPPGGDSRELKTHTNRGLNQGSPQGWKIGPKIGPNIGTQKTVIFLMIFSFLLLKWVGNSPIGQIQPKISLWARSFFRSILPKIDFCQNRRF